MKIEYGHDGGVNRCVFCCMEISQMQPAILSVNDCTSSRISITARRCNNYAFEVKVHHSCVKKIEKLFGPKIMSLVSGKRKIW